MFNLHKICVITERFCCMKWFDEFLYLFENMLTRKNNTSAYNIELLLIFRRIYNSISSLYSIETKISQ